MLNRVVGAITGGFERRATMALGRRAANFFEDTVENIGQNILTDGMADLAERATGRRPNIHTPVTAGSFGALGYTYLCGQYNRAVAEDVANGVPSRSTMSTLGADATQTAAYTRVAMIARVPTQS